MKKAVLISLVLTLLLLTINSFAATFTSIRNGAWTDPLTWGNSSTGPIPGTTDIVNVNHTVAYPSGNYTEWNAGGQININNNGTLTGTNLGLTGGGFRIVVRNGGTFAVSGTLTLNNQPAITVDGGGTFSASTFNMQQSTALTVANNGDVNIGTMSVANSATISNSGDIAVTGTLTQGQSTITIANTGRLSANTLNMSSSASITMNGASSNLSLVNLSMPDGSNTAINYNNGTIAVSNNLTVGTGTTFNYTKTMAIGGNVVLKNGSSLTASSVGGSTVDIQGGSILTVTGGTMSPTSLNIAGANSELRIAGATVNYNPSLTLTNNARLTVSSGSYNSTGTLTLTNQGKLNQSGGAISVGSFDMPNNSNTQYNYTGGTLAVTNNLTVGSGVTFNYPGSFALNGNVAVRNGSTVFASKVGGTTIDIQNGSTLVLTGGTVAPTSLTINGSNSELRVEGASVSYTPAVTLTNSAKLTVNSGSFTTAGQLNVNGGIFSSSAGATIGAASLDVSNSGTSSFTNGGTFNVSGSVSQGRTLVNNGTMNITGSFSSTGSATSNNYGVMNIGGNMTFDQSSKFQVHPGGITTVDGNVTTIANQNLIVGTPVNPPAYADMVIKGNLRSTGSGDVLVDRNGRLAVFGNYSSDSNGSSQFVVADGGQVYVNGPISFNGGGDHLTNNNDGNPYYGVYSNNQPTYAPSSNGSSNGTAGANSVQNVATMQSQNKPFYDWVANIPNSPLPVELVSFQVSSVDETTVTLVWQTAIEKNFDRFEVEAADATLIFEKLGSVKGKGSVGKGANYSFVNNAPIRGTQYYRLKMIDVDGQFNYSRVISTKWNGVTSNVQVYPNPVVDHTFTIALDDTFDSPVNISVVEARGYVVYTATTESRSSHVSLPENLATGVYLVKIASSAKTETVRLVVR